MIFIKRVWLLGGSWLVLAAFWVSTHKTTSNWGLLASLCVGAFVGYLILSNIPTKQVDMSKVTRFEVIDGTGRAYTKHGVKVALSFQDSDRTLKVFVEEAGEQQL